jgi:hypothetical protein
MPDFTIRDPSTGRTVKVRGDSPPTEAELEDIFAALPAAKPVDPAMAARVAEQKAALLPAIPSQPTPPGQKVVKGPWWNPIEVPENTGAERNRPDNSVLGMPPELAILAPVAAGRAITAATSTASKAKTAATAAVGQVAATVKYEVVKRGLETVGIPSWMASVAAMAVSGNKRGVAPKTPRQPSPVAAKKAADAAASQRMIDGMSGKPAPSATVAPTAPIVAPAPPQAAAAPVGPIKAPTASALKPEQIADGINRAARKSNTNLTPDQNRAADALVRDGGLSPVEAVLTVKNAGQSVSAATQFAQMMLGLGAKTDDQARAALLAKNYKTGSKAPLPKR